MLTFANLRLTSVSSSRQSNGWWPGLMCLCQVNVEDRIKLEELPAHPWLQAAPAPGVVAGVGVPIPSARPAPGHTLNSVGSTASQSPPPAPSHAPSHAKLYRRTGAGPGSSADRRGKLTKNTENNSILAAGDFPPLPPAPAPPSYKLSVKDLKNEANEARKAEVGRGGWGVFCPASSPAPGTSCRVKVEQMEGADTMQLLSHATAYATL